MNKLIKIEKIKLPGRPIVKLNDPTEKEIEELDKNTIVKIILNKKISSGKKESLIELTKKQVKNGGMIVIDQTSRTKKRDDYSGSIIDITIDNLLEIYSKEREVELIKLKEGFELIRE